jgi:hypothetical protein
MLTGTVLYMCLSCTQRISDTCDRFHWACNEHECLSRRRGVIIMKTFLFSVKFLHGWYTWCVMEGQARFISDRKLRKSGNGALPFVSSRQWPRVLLCVRRLGMTFWTTLIGTRYIKVIAQRYVSWILVGAHNWPEYTEQRYIWEEGRLRLK